MCVVVCVFIEKKNTKRDPVDSLSSDFLHVLSNCVSFQYSVFNFLMKVITTNF